MIFPVIYLIGFISVLSVGGIEYGKLQSSIASISKQEFCSGSHNVRIDPTYVPQLLDYLKHCSILAKQPNVDSFARRQAVIHLFNAATPVIHKAFFDSKTALKYVVLFTKLKHEAVQYANYANKYGDHSMYSRKKVSAMEGRLTYAPGDGEGSYNLKEDLRICASILNRQQNTSVRNIIKASQLPRVAKAARIITFPPFNLSVAVSSDDTPYMILDMYVLAMRCLSFTNLHPNTTAQVSEHLINTLKKKIMPFVPPHGFERAYAGMMSMGKPVGKHVVGAALKTVSTTSSVKRSSATSTTKQPVVLRLQSFDDDNTSDAGVEESAISILTNFTTSPKKSFREAFVALLKGNHQDEDNSTLVVTAKVGREEVTDRSVVVIISVALSVCATLAVVLYCLLFGCCGWVTIAADAQEHDEVDECLEGYARLSPGNREDKCYCTLADTNQMDVIAALHQRCELLSKKICEVAREISKENIFDNPASMDALREFVRSVSTNMVDENETIYHFGKSMSSFIQPQNKISSVKDDTL